MTTLEGPVLSLVVEKDGRRLVLFGDYHDRPPRPPGKSVKITDFLKRVFDREMTFYAECYRNSAAPYEEDSPECPLESVCAIALKGDRYPKVKFVLNDMRFEHLPLYSELHNAFNFPEDFPSPLDRTRSIVELYTQTTAHLSQVQKGHAFDRDFLQIKQNRDLFFKVVYEMNATSRALAATKEEEIDTGKVEATWFFQMLILNDLFTLQDFLQSKTQLSISYMGYYHAANIAYRLIHDHGYRLVWSSSGPVRAPDIEGKNSQGQIEELCTLFKMDGELRQWISFDERFVEKPTPRMEVIALKQRVWNAFRRLF